MARLQINLFIDKISSTKGIIILFVLAHLVFLSMMIFPFPIINNQIGTLAFDLRTFGYTYEDAVFIIQNLNESTTQFYLFPQLLLLDILYPLLLALFFSAFFNRLVKLVLSYKSAYTSGLIILPFFTMLFDYMENTMVLLLITKSIKCTQTSVAISSSLTCLKSSSTILSWFILVILLCVFLIQKLTNRHHDLSS